MVTCHGDHCMTWCWCFACRCEFLRMSMLPHDTGLRVAAPSNSVRDTGRSGCLRELPSHVRARSVGFVHATRSHNPPGTEVQECREKMSERLRTCNVDLSPIFFVVSVSSNSCVRLRVMTTSRPRVERVSVPSIEFHRSRVASVTVAHRKGHDWISLALPVHRPANSDGRRGAQVCPQDKVERRHRGRPAVTSGVSRTRRQVDQVRALPR